jgi:16S rRNA (guanine527-N7)-methyltransferase
MTGTNESPDVSDRLNKLLARAGEPELDPELARRFGLYLSLLVRWNARLNLTGIRDEEEILSRHFVESIACARAIPAGVSTLLDFGSGAGLPGIPIALCRPEISVTLAESQTKKAAFLREAVRTLGLNTVVYGQRAETLQTGFGGVAMRAVDRMERAVAAAAGLVASHGWLILMATGKELAGLQAAAGQDFEWSRTVRLAPSEDRLIAMGVRTG